MIPAVDALIQAYQACLIVLSDVGLAHHQKLSGSMGINRGNFGQNDTFYLFS